LFLIGSGCHVGKPGCAAQALDPALRIQVYEAADELAYESSNGWNNAGTVTRASANQLHAKREADGTVKCRR